MTKDFSRSIACILVLGLVPLVEPLSVLRAEDAPVEVTGDGRCDSLGDIPFAKMTSPYLEPLTPWRVTQMYNPSEKDPNFKPGHNGLDLGGEFLGGTVGKEQIRASFAGKVLISKFEPGWGNSIVVISRIHPSSKEVLTSHYHHLHVRYAAHCGSVERGQLLGLEGKTGDPDYLAHLHFTVRHWASMEHLNNWLSKSNGDYLIFGNDAYFGHNGNEFRGSYEPGNIKLDSPYARYGHLNPEALLKDYFSDYGKGAVDPNAPHAWSAPFAKKMRYYGIDLGEWNGEFGAGMPAKRREAARWLRIALGSKVSTPEVSSPIFSDVPSNDPDYTYIQSLTQYPSGVSVVNPTHSCNGAGSPAFCPDAELNRASALKMVVLALYPNEFYEFNKNFFWVQTAANASPALANLLGIPVSLLFSDVDVTSWYAPYVYFGVFKGLVSIQLKFNPSASVIRAELAKWVIMIHERLHGANAVDPCTGISCAVGQYCEPSTGACVVNAPCVSSEDKPCEVGGGLSNGPGCTNGLCEPGETCQNCPQDCGNCPPGCPDGICGGTETCSSCPQDCGTCPASCSDGICNGGETCLSCPQDCGACPASCSDGQCNGTETCSSCPQDCGACPAVCSDGQCNGTETCSSCPQDCGNCPCNASSYWSPSTDTDTDNTGAQSNGASISVPISVEVRESGSGLEARVCKPGSTFSSNIAFSIYDAATNSTCGASVTNLQTQGLGCSSWVQLQNDTGYAQGQQFGGTWQVVSPASVASDWSFPFAGCTANGTPNGTCWNGFGITMTRSCK